MAQHSLKELLALAAKRDLRADLVRLDKEIEAMRVTVASQSEGPASQDDKSEVKTYDDIEDVPKLQRLVKARERTLEHLEKKVGWVALEAARKE